MLFRLYFVRKAYMRGMISFIFTMNEWMRIKKFFLRAFFSALGPRGQQSLYMNEEKLVQNIRTHLTFTINNVLFSRFISQLFIPLNGLVKLNRGTLHLIELLNHN